jgi:methyl-accepting chemotaxis protein
VLLVYVLNLSELRKLRELNISMEEIAKGNFGYQLEVHDNDDISQLMVTFNYMSHHIADLLQVFQQF